MGNKKFQFVDHVDEETILKMYENYRPVFVLSTGRTGSKFIHELFSLSGNAASHHEPLPKMEYFAKEIYRCHNLDTMEKIFNVARMELILDAYIRDKIYLETNHAMTFFAPVINRLFKESVFIHVARHPGDFVRSALRKGWYANDTIWESGRIKGEDSENWNKLDHIERLGWLWKTTNEFIERFKKSIDSPERVAFFRSEDLFEDPYAVKKLSVFAGIEDISFEKIEKLQSVKVNEVVINDYEPQNMKKIEFYPTYEEWSELDRDKLNHFTAELSEKYGYSLEVKDLSLINQFSSLEAKNRELYQKIEDSENIISAKEREIGNLELALTELKDDLQSKKKSEIEITSKLTKEKQETDRLKALVERNNGILAQHKVRIQEEKSRADHLAGLLQKNNAILEEHKKRIQEEKSRAERLQNQLQHNNDILNDHKKRIQEEKSRTERLQSQLQQSNDILNDHKKRIWEEKSKSDRMSYLVEIKSELIVELQKRIMTDEHKYSKKLDLIEIKNQKIYELNINLAEEVALRNRLEAELAEKRESLEKIESALESEKNMLRELFENKPSTGKEIRLLIKRLIS